MKYRKTVVIAFIAVFIFIFFFGGYTCWNEAAPEKTCASCHEISHSVNSFQYSAHRDLSCSECHGTALSNGWHSFKEKANMVFTHIGGDIYHHDIRMNEEQVLAIIEDCFRCHQSEHANWLTGPHSATYKDIFIDSVHNSMEAPYADCFRCHGMFYDGTIRDLMEPISTEGPWHMKDPEKEHQYTVPCLACHQIHMDNELLAESLYDSIPRNPAIALYVRNDQIYLRADKLVKPAIYHDGTEVRTSDNYSQRLCGYCHSPNYAHISGTEDDRTTRGVHEGLSCNSCHKPHSTDTRNSCVSCHPPVSTNCKLDVRTMNTTYFDLESPNNIHFVSCQDCHEDIFN